MTGAVLPGGRARTGRLRSPSTLRVPFARPSRSLCRASARPASSHSALWRLPARGRRDAAAALEELEHPDRTVIQAEGLSLCRQHAEAGEPLDCKTIVERASEKGHWRSDGKTPAATIYAAILREIQKKGDGAGFRKAATGKFELVM